MVLLDQAHVKQDHCFLALKKGIICPRKGGLSKNFSPRTPPDNRIPVNQLYHFLTLHPLQGLTPHDTIDKCPQGGKRVGMVMADFELGGVRVQLRGLEKGRVAVYIAAGMEKIGPIRIKGADAKAIGEALIAIGCEKNEHLD